MARLQEIYRKTIVPQLQRDLGVTTMQVPKITKITVNMGVGEAVADRKVLDAAIGDLNRVERIVKVLSLVNSTADYVEQHLVTNGCSELIGEVFGEKGAHARSAFGVAQLPFGSCVEIELIAQVP